MQLLFTNLSMEPFTHRTLKQKRVIEVIFVDFLLCEILSRDINCLGLYNMFVVQFKT